MATDRTDISRRNFLRTAAATSLSLIASSSLLTTLSGCGDDDDDEGLVTPRTGERVSVNLNDNGFEALRQVGGILKRNFGSNRNGGRDVIIRRISPTEFRTVSAVCPHKRCDVGAPNETNVVCPCHQAVFSMQAGNFGALLSGPGRSLDSFETAFNAETQILAITF
ncbi:MAG: Rieske (2Fe-2S) protein [Chloroherpetonaceae bacterium]